MRADESTIGIMISLKIHEIAYVFSISKVTLYLWADEGNEEHEPNNLNEALCGLGETEEFHDDAVPEELTDKGEDDEGNDEGENHGEAVGVDFLLLGGGSIGEAFNCHTGGGGYRRVHFSIKTGRKSFEPARNEKWGLHYRKDEL